MKIFDCHNDFLTEINNNKLEKYINNKIKDNKVCASIWATNYNEIEAINYIEKLNNLKLAHKNIYSLVEDCHFITPSNLDIVLSQKIGLAGLVWNKDNNLAGGAYGAADLSEFGKIVVNKFEDAGTILDTAHLNEISFNSLLKLTRMPVVCSHTAFYGCLNHKRNLKDYQIKLIIESGGVVGLAFVSEFLTGTKFSTIKNVSEQIVYFAIKFGTAGLCIGTDFYGTKQLPLGLKNYAAFNSLEKDLLKKGFTAEEVENIFYNNLNNFMIKNTN